MTTLQVKLKSKGRKNLKNLSRNINKLFLIRSRNKKEKRRETLSTLLKRLTPKRVFHRKK